MIHWAGLTDQGFRCREDRSIEVVEAIRSIPRELEVLSLVLAHWDMSSSSWNIN